MRAAAAGLVLGAVLAGAAHSTPLPLSAFFDSPATRGAQISPSGRYVALIERRGVTDVVAVFDIQSLQTSIALRPKDGRAIDWIRWKDDERLVAGLAPKGDEADVGDEPADRDSEELTALNRDGSARVQLSAGARIAAGSGPALRIADPLKRDPGHVLVVAPDDKGAPAVWKVDVHSGSAEFVRAGADDPEDQIPRGALSVRYDHRSAASTEFDVLGPAQKGGRFAYVAMQPRTASDGDVATVRIYDFERKTFSDPVWPAGKYDVSDVVYHEGDMALAGVCYTADTYQCDFADKSLDADYKRAQAAFDDRRSLTPLSMSDDGRYWLLGVQGPEEPGAYYVWDRHDHHMTLVANRHPGLPTSRLGTMERFVYTARDGTRIPGYVTRPPGAARDARLPMIVMPHGGPEARDSFAFDIWTQYFATRGYMVFQPNFRGSSGYGRKWAEAGYGQWGRRTQDDITDGVKALIADGRADSSRICIFGASFGGYSALYGGAETPQLYKCVASFAGVSDLKSLVEWEHTTPGHLPRWRYAVRAIGDPARDAARLKASSPITYAADYKVPVLLIHGEKDQSVPVRQSQDMERALKRAGAPVKLLLVKGEGHADWRPDHEEAALTELAAFFEAHIAPAR